MFAAHHGGPAKTPGQVAPYPPEFYSHDGGPANVRAVMREFLALPKPAVLEALVGFEVRNLANVFKKGGTAETAMLDDSWTPRSAFAHSPPTAEAREVSLGAFFGPFGDERLSTPLAGRTAR